MRYKLWMTSGATAALVAASAAVPAMAGDDASRSVDSLVPAFTEPQISADVVPENIDLDALGGIAADSTRFLGDDGYAEYWVGRAGAANVCLIMAVKGEGEIVAASCPTITTFYRQGIGLVAGADPNEPETSAEAYLLPADITVEDLDLGATLYARSANRSTDETLVSLRPGESDDSPRSIEREDGNAFQFAPVSATLGGENG